MFFTCILFGYDSLAGGVVVAISEFRKHFGAPFGGDYVIDANWQIGYTAATLVGMILVNKLGRQPVMAAMFGISIGGICLEYFADTNAPFFWRQAPCRHPHGLLHLCRALLCLRDSALEHPRIYHGWHELCRRFGSAYRLRRYEASQFVFR
jgi:hypothetical protein